DHCLSSINYINVIVADKKVHLQYLDMEAAIAHCTKRAGIWDWASKDQGTEPDVVMASCGDVPTMESLAAAALLREHLPGASAREALVDQQIAAKEHAYEFGVDRSEITDWKWPF